LRKRRAAAVAEQQIDKTSELQRKAMDLFLRIDLAGVPDVALGSFKWAVGGVRGKQKLPQSGFATGFINLVEQFRVAFHIDVPWPTIGGSPRYLECFVVAPKLDREVRFHRALVRRSRLRSGLRRRRRGIEVHLRNLASAFRCRKVSVV